LLVILYSLITFSQSTASCVTLTWTAPGDDGNSGCASKYEVRYSTSPITEATWNSATQAVCPFLPSPAGTFQILSVSGLEGGRDYYFAVRTADECGNWSELSNVIVREAPIEECLFTVGNANCDPYDEVSVADIAAIAAHLFMDIPVCCLEEANVNGDPEGRITISDAMVLIEYLFMDGRPLPYCPSQ
jgi:hypothetical protein